MIETVEHYEDFVDNIASIKVHEDNRAIWAVMGLVAEAGEVCGRAEKFVRKGEKETDEFYDDIISELGDTLYFLTLVAHSCGTDLHGLMWKNYEKLTQRIRDGKMDDVVSEEWLKYYKAEDESSN